MNRIKDRVSPITGLWLRGVGGTVAERSKAQPGPVTTADTVVIADKQMQNKSGNPTPHGRESVICDEHWKRICECCGGEEHLLQYMGVEDKRESTKT